MRNIQLESLDRVPVEEQQVELVERKGMGHPDSICDAIMEEISVALCREYVKAFGRILHHNIDKSLLVAGRTSPRIGGGTVHEPMRLVFGDRAVYEYQGKKIPVEEIAIETAKNWLRENLRFVDPEEHLIFQNEIKPGSPELTDIFEREVIGANDTSAAVGYAPMTETERIVLATESYLNSSGFKDVFPECGEDVKIMGYRSDRDLWLTVAIAFVDRFVQSESHYFARKGEIVEAITDFVRSQSSSITSIRVDLNTLDAPGRGEAGMYLTVLGTSGESADSGQVGRGNKVNGVIALNRPMSTEAAAGKNPVSHVGKIYNLLSHHIAEKVYKEVAGVREVYIWLSSQIGLPIEEPIVIAGQLVLEPGFAFATISKHVEKIINDQIDGIYEFSKSLTRGEMTVW